MIQILAKKVKPGVNWRISLAKNKEAVIGV